MWKRHIKKEEKMQNPVYIKVKEIYTHQIETARSSSTWRRDRQETVSQPAEES